VFIDLAKFSKGAMLVPAAARFLRSMFPECAKGTRRAASAVRGVASAGSNRTPTNAVMIAARIGILIALVFVSIPSPCLWQQTASSASAAAPKDNWTLSWSDDFNGPNGAPPDQAKWVVDSGGNGWGNNELESYTSRRKNVRQEDGHLVLEARSETFKGRDGIRRNYTSGRISTAGRFSQKYGRFEARIQNPSGRGVWPAFWMLGDDFSTAGWPACGEIDIMEEIGSSDAETHSSLHGPGYSGSNALTSSFHLPAGNFGDAYHIFALEWEPGVARFYVDGNLYGTKTRADLPPGTHWAFDRPFFLILDLAVGGDMPSNPDRSTIFPQRMLVDYVRVYSHQ
jgi:beta-glucanase (GH16 family)